MSILDFESNESSGSFWNYSDETKDNYTPKLTGDVTLIETVQARDFKTKQPVFWDDGNPKLNIRITVAMPDDSELKWTFSPGGRGDKATAAMKAVRQGLVKASKPGESVSELGGCAVTIETKPGVYNQSHPRPWHVVVHGDGSHAFQGVQLWRPEGQAHPAHQASPAQGANPVVRAAQQAQEAWADEEEIPW